MPRHRRHELDPETADRLLAGRGDGPPHLSELLARAAAPGRPEELVGEDAAAAVFRSAQTVPVFGPRRRIVQLRWARWVTVKTGALALALAAGGVALAAGTGALPSPLTIGAAAPTRTPQSTAHVAASGSGQDSRIGPAVGKASPSASLPGLCTALLAEVATAPGMATQNPAYAELIVAAGAGANITAYCQSLLNGPSGTATSHGRSDGHPTGPPSPHPTGHDPRRRASESPR
jgi:hypothetical protein